MKIMIKSYSLYMDRTRSPWWPRVTKVSEAGGSKRQCPSVLSAGLVVAGWEFLRTSLRTVYTVSTHKTVPVRQCQAVCSGVTVRWKVKAAPSARWGAEQHQPLPTLLLLADQALALVSSR